MPLSPTSKSFSKMLKRTRPKMEPCRTPLVTCCQPDVIPFTLGGYHRANLYYCNNEMLSSALLFFQNAYSLEWFSIEIQGILSLLNNFCLWSSYALHCTFHFCYTVPIHILAELPEKTMTQDILELQPRQSFKAIKAITVYAKEISWK